jgi:AAA+ superfamily predicted ATPase
LWDDYEHLGESRDKLAAFLKAAVSKSCKGVNVLLYGQSGTGKTEFCKTLAAYLDMSLYTVIESDAQGCDPSRNERIASLKLNHSLLGESKNALVLFDEMDDLFEWSLFGLLGGRPHGISKVFTNRLLENNPVPTFWTINNVEWLDPAIVSRMDLAIEIKVPPPEARTRVWGRVLEKNKVILPQAEVRRLARQEKVPPRIIQSAVRFSRLMGGSPEDIRFVTNGMVQAIQGGARNEAPHGIKGTFLPELANADLDLEKLADGLIGTEGHRSFSLCLYGRPGTGKSVFARYLAEQLGMEVLYRRASDLFGMYVGESEKNIAKMFEQARDEGAFLILDEADAVLYDRREAHQRSDVSQVTEMLAWMESHPLPFVCTTNLMENLDMASLRRFTFKVRFDYMTPKQNALAFQHFFGREMTVTARELNNLSPGDYAVVVNKARLLGDMESPERLVEMLQSEVKARQEIAGSVGFAV